MHPKSIFAIKDWRLPEILLIAVACFALAAIGFFIAVYLQVHIQSSDIKTIDSVSAPASVEEKDKLYQQLNGSREGQAMQTDMPVNPANENSTSVDEKRKLLQQLQSH